MNRLLYIICACLFVTCCILYETNLHTKAEKKRLENNNQALMSDVVYYQDEVGRHVASVQMLELKVSELEQNKKELSSVINSLRIKLKRVESATMTATATEVKAKPQIIERVVSLDSVKACKLPTIEWQDPWVSVTGVILPDNHVEMTIRSVDTLYQVVHRIPKRFWFIRYGVKAIKQEIRSSNPHTKIVYSEYIELQKKRRRIKR